jgi:uncharacterized protein (DUF1778 family)
MNYVFVAHTNERMENTCILSPNWRGHAMSPAAASIRRSAETETATRTTTINLRISQVTRQLIDTAAAVVGKSRTEFMLESARQHAIDVLLDQRLFVLSTEQHDAFMNALDNPPLPNAELKKLLSSKSPWEK